MEQNRAKADEEKKLVIVKPPYPTEQGEMTREEFLAIRQVTSGQLFGKTELPRQRS